MTAMLENRFSGNNWENAGSERHRPLGHFGVWPLLPRQFFVRFAQLHPPKVLVDNGFVTVLKS